MQKFVYLLLITVGVKGNPLVDEDEENTIDVSHFGTRMYGLPDEEFGEYLASLNETELHPEQIGPYLEGDILIPHFAPRNGLTPKHLLWPKGEIPYVISPQFSEHAKDIIEKHCMDAYRRFTCIKFRKKTSADINYLYINNGKSGCWANVGMVGGKQTANLQEGGCTYKVGTCMHELLHVVGFFHEHTRSDRDQYVKVANENIRPGMEGNFLKVDPKTTSGFGYSYDYGSVMHYNEYAFSRGNAKTIIPLKKTMDEIGQREKLSRLDILKINKMYNCNRLADTTAPGGSLGSIVSGLLGFMETDNTIEDAEEIVPV